MESVTKSSIGSTPYTPIEETTFQDVRRQLNKIEGAFSTKDGSIRAIQQFPPESGLNESSRQLVNQWAKGELEGGKLMFGIALDSQTQRQNELNRLGKHEKECTENVQRELKALEEKLTDEIETMTKASANLRKDMISVQKNLMTMSEATASEATADIAEGHQKLFDAYGKIQEQLEGLGNAKVLVQKLASDTQNLSIKELQEVQRLANSMQLNPNAKDLIRLTQSLLDSTLQLVQARVQLADLKQGIELSDQALGILQKAGDIEVEAVTELNVAITNYSKALERLMAANDDVWNKNKELEEAENEAKAWGGTKSEKETRNAKVVDKRNALKAAEKELAEAKDEGRQAQEAQSKILKEISKGVDRTKIQKNIEELRLTIRELETKKSGVGTEGLGIITREIATLQKNLERYENIEQVLSRYGARMDNPVEASRQKEESDVAMAFKRMEAWIRSWGPSTDEIQSLVATIKIIESDTAFKEEYGDMEYKPIEDQKTLFALMDATNRLEQIEKTFRGVAGLEQYKRDIEENLAFCRSLAIGFACTVVLIPLILIVGLFYAAYNLKLEGVPIGGLEKPVDKALEPIKKWLPRITKTFEEGQKMADELEVERTRKKKEEEEQKLRTATGSISDTINLSEDEF